MRRQLMAVAVFLLCSGIAAAQATADRTIRVSAAVIAGNKISGPEPVYPADAKAAGIQGAVVLSVEITKTGEVQNPRVISGPATLGVAAMEAVSQWMYKPYLLNGQPVEVSSLVTVNFALAETASAGQPVAPVASGAAKTDRANGATGSVAALPAGFAGAAIPVRVGPARVSAGVMAGNLIQKANPVYPKEAKKAHISGSVVIHAVISKTGDVENLVVISGPEELRESALTAVRQWKYRPYVLNGNPTEVDTQITVNYMFSERPQSERDKWQSMQ